MERDKKGAVIMTRDLGKKEEILKEGSVCFLQREY